MISRPNRTDRRVVIIAHSLGGLDARYMLSKLDMADHVAALVTITTPHRGSPYADWCMRHFGHRLGGLKLMALLGIDVEGIVDLTAERCQRFNQTIQDVPGVRYFSVSAVQAWNKVPTFARHAHKTVYEAEGDNDSLVSVQSSTWATHLGVWPADHWHTINRRHGRGANRTADIAPYYLGVLDQLRERGVWN
jgi:triacylglycerol lipase